MSVLLLWLLQTVTWIISVNHNLLECSSLKLTCLEESQDSSNIFIEIKTWGWMVWELDPDLWKALGLINSEILLSPHGSRVVRKSIARVLTVINQTQKENLRKFYKVRASSRLSFYHHITVDRCSTVGLFGSLVKDDLCELMTCWCITTAYQKTETWDEPSCHHSWLFTWTANVCILLLARLKGMLASKLC